MNSTPNVTCRLLNDKPRLRPITLLDHAELRCEDFTDATFLEVEHEEFNFTIPYYFSSREIKKTGTTISHGIKKYKSYEPTQELTIPEAFPCEEELPPLTKDN